MPYATINKPSLQFNTVTYTGNSSTQSITGVGFQPEFVWIKDGTGATATYSHYLFDAIRTATKYIKSNSADVEATGANYLTSFNADGFSLGSFAGVNANGDAIVAWNWKANGAGVANTAGTISSTVSANTTAGFSIVTYTSPNSASDQTVGHGLGVAPSFIITKNLDIGYSWDIHHKGLSSGNGICFDTGVPRAGVFGSMTSTTFGTKTNYTHNSTNRYIAYCFAEVKGYSKFSTYIGNGSADGTFVYTGFKPAFVMAKCRTNSGQWSICDNRRGTANTANGTFLFAESSEATNSAPANWDFLSNGFKARANYAAHNVSAEEYIYMAFAEQPLVGTNNIPCTAR